MFASLVFYFFKHFNTGTKPWFQNCCIHLAWTLLFCAWICPELGSAQTPQLFLLEFFNFYLPQFNILLLKCCTEIPLCFRVVLAFQDNSCFSCWCWNRWMLVRLRWIFGEPGAVKVTKQGNKDIKWVNPSLSRSSSRGISGGITWNCSLSSSVHGEGLELAEL